MLRPLDLVGHVGASLGTGGGVINVKEVLPIRPIVPFQRIRDSKTREAHEVLIALPGTQSANTVSKVGNLFPRFSLYCTRSPTLVATLPIRSDVKPNNHFYTHNIPGFSFYPHFTDNFTESCPSNFTHANPVLLQRQLAVLVSTIRPIRLCTLGSPPRPRLLRALFTNTSAIIESRRFCYGLCR